MKSLIALLSILALLAGAAAWLLDTTAGLRWTVDQVLARSGAAVTIGGVHGRLLGPISLSNVRYGGSSGTRVRLQAIRIDWRPADLLYDLLHVTDVRISGLDYTGGPSRAGAGPGKKGTMLTMLPEIALPLGVKVDRLTVAPAAIDTGSGEPLQVESLSLAASLQGRSLELSGLQLATPRYRVGKGRVHLELKAGLPITGSLDWSASPADMPALAGAFEVRGAVYKTLEPSIQVRQPFPAHIEGTVSDVRTSPTWTLDVSIPKAVSLADIRKSWPAVTLQGVVYGNGNTSRAHLQPDVSLAFQGRNVQVSGDASLTPGALVINRARLARPGASGSGVQLAGRVGLARRLPFKIQGGWTSLKGPAQAPWTSRSGRFEASGDRSSLVASLSGVITPPQQSTASDIKVDVKADHLEAQPVLSGTANVPYFAWGDLRATGLKADIDYHAAADAASRVIVTARTLQAGSRQATGVRLQARGTTRHHDLALDGTLDGWPVSLELTGRYSPQRWQGRLTRLSVSSNSDTLPGHWNLAHAVDVSWSRSGAEIGKLCLGHQGALLCAGGRFAGGKNWGLTAQASGIPLKWLTPKASDSLKIEGAVNASASLADSGKGIEGKAEAKVGSATITWTSEQPVVTHYRSVEFNAALNPSTLHLALDASVDGTGTIHGELTTADPLAADGPIQGSIKARLPSLRLVRAAFPDLGLTGGSARLEFQIAGTRSAPRFDGAGRVEKAAFDISALGVQLDSLNLDVRSSNGRRLHVAAEARAGDGTVKAGGELEFPAGEGWRGNFNITGSKALLVRLPQAVITGNPDLHISLNKTSAKVTGRVQVTQADLTPEAARPKVTISSDVVVVGGKAPRQPTSNPLNWDFNFTVDLGDHTRFKGYGLSGRLAGSLALIAPAHQATRANGSVQIHDGQYSFYGRTFDITKGALLYAGGPIDDPGIDMQVGRKAGNVSVTLAATGPLANPNISLSSTPAMSDTDKMSYLLLGRPASQASGAEATVLIKAAASLIPGGAHGATGYLQSKLGLDTLEIKTESTQSPGTPKKGTSTQPAPTEGTSLVLGKYLSPRLYVSYAAGVQQAVDVFRVRYELARHWILQAESSATASGGDLLFKW